MGLNSQSRPLAARIVITDRDRQILEAAFAYGVITRDQLQMLLSWNCVSDINRRLKKLRDYGYLDCRSQRPKIAMIPAIYLLGAQGCTVLAEAGGKEKASCERRRQRYRHLGASLLPHELAITQFACCLTASLNIQSEGELLDWVPTDGVRDHWQINETITDLSLQPDACGSYRLRNRQFNFFLELDRGTETLERIRKKVEFYRVLKSSRLFDQRVPKRSFRLLFIVPSRPRAAHICQALDVVTDLKIFVAPLGELNTALLSACIWRRPGERDLTALHAATELTETLPHALLPALPAHQ